MLNILVVFSLFLLTHSGRILSNSESSLSKSGPLKISIRSEFSPTLELSGFDSEISSRFSRVDLQTITDFFISANKNASWIYGSKSEQNFHYLEPLRSPGDLSRVQGRAYPKNLKAAEQAYAIESLTGGLVQQ